MTARREILYDKNFALADKAYQFTLYNATWGTLISNFAPDGWNDEVVFERNKISRSVLRSYSDKELGFTKDTRDFLRNCYEIEGIDAEVTWTVEHLDMDTFTYSTIFIGKLDFATYKIDSRKVTIQPVSNVFIDLIKNREDLPVNLYDLTSVDGVEIVPFSNEDPQLKLLEVDIKQSAIWGRNTPWSTPDDKDHYLPLKKLASEFPEAQNQLITDTIPMFSASTEERTMKMTGTISGHVLLETSTMTWEFEIYLKVGIIEYGVELFDGIDTDNIQFSLILDEDLTVHTGDIIELTARITGVSCDAATSYQVINVHLDQVYANYPEVTVKGYPVYEAFLRILQKITGDANPFYSEYFGRTDTELTTYPIDGEIAHLAKGIMIRGVTGDLMNFALDFQSTFKAISNIFCLGYGWESIGDVNKLRIESFEHFFDLNVVLDISNRITDEKINKEVLPDWCYAKIETGYNSFEYSQQGGLYEFNTKSVFTSILKAVKNSLGIMSSIRADGNGILKLRLTPYEDNPTEDVSGDDNTWLIASVRDNGGFKNRTDEGYSWVGGGVDATQSINLDYSPKRNLLRWGSWIRSALEGRLNSWLRWQSTEKNTTLITAKTGETTATAENGNIHAHELNEPLWLPEAYNVESPFHWTDYVAINANPNGIIKLAADKYGWIIELKTNNVDNKAEFKLLRVNLNYVTPIEIPV